MLKRLTFALAFITFLTNPNSTFLHKSYAQDSSTTAPAQPVSTLVVKAQSIDITNTFPGRASPYRQAQIRPQVNGIITARYFEEGQMIEKGEQLYQIDDTRYAALLSSAQADLKSAQATVKSIKAKADRYKKLVKINAISQQEYDDIEASLDQANANIDVAKAEIEIAKINLDYTKVYAPISGRIGKSYVTEGALVTASQTDPLAIITQLDPIYVDITYSGEAALKLRPRLTKEENIPVSILLTQDDSFYPHKGTLKFSEVTVDETTGAIGLRAVVPNPEQILLPGLFVQTQLILEKKDNVILVPQRATSRQPNGDLQIWTVDSNNKTQLRTIKINGAHQDNWITTSGLNDGDKIIIEGYQKVSPGALVSPTPWQK